MFRVSQPRLLVMAFAASLAGSAYTAPAHAVDANVPFTSVVASTCAVVLGVPGVMNANAANTELDSANGTSGTAVITTTGTNFELSAIAPSDFTIKPPTYAGSTTFTATYSAGGATTLPSGAGGTARTLLPGVSTASVDLKAVSDSGPFHAGNYTAVVTVRCEAAGGA